jgi:hypothetical protein
VDTLSTVGQIGHQGPKVDQAFLESLLGACPGFDPPQLHTSTFCCLTYHLNRETGESAGRTNLHWRIRFKADTKRSLRDWGQTGREVPKRQTSHNRSGNKDRRSSP